MLGGHPASRIILSNLERSAMLATMYPAKNPPKCSSTACAHCWSLSLMCMPMGPMGGLENSFARCCSSLASAGMPRPNFSSWLPSSFSALRRLASASCALRSKAVTPLRIECSSPFAAATFLSSSSSRARSSSSATLVPSLRSSASAMSRWMLASCACDCCSTLSRALAMASCSAAAVCVLSLMLLSCALRSVSLLRTARSQSFDLRCATAFSSSTSLTRALNASKRAYASSFSALLPATTASCARSCSSSFLVTVVRWFSTRSSSSDCTTSASFTSAHARRLRSSSTLARYSSIFWKESASSCSVSTSCSTRGSSSSFSMISLSISATAPFTYASRCWMSSRRVALTKNLYLSVSLPEWRNSRVLSWDITTMGLSTSMLKWSVMRTRCSLECPTSLPHWLLILNGALPLALMVRSTVITSP
mmetsp:Transcript_38319/g.95080  ORF Transcript_38319/g.95080 Transcript_38319/m.95080 type:complete len:422 (+) Transcript_38319:1896-3161(+)